MKSVNDLIVDLITTGRQATAEELAIIIAHVAQAPFATYLSRVLKRLRRLIAKGGAIVPRKLSSLEIHLFKRIYFEKQWPVGTTAKKYVADLHQAISHPDVYVWTYRYFGPPFVSFLAPSHVQGGFKPERYIFVAYSPLHGTITTGYQASDSSKILTDEFTELVQHR